MPAVHRPKHLLGAVYRLERAADHAASMAKAVLYLVLGQIVRHRAGNAGASYLAKTRGCDRMIPHVLSMLYFILAGLCEIGGGYLIWLWLRGGKPLGYGVLGAGILILYGVIPTLQPAHFSRVYAAYGGVFIALSLLWGWQIDRIVPDRADLIGAGIALVGVAVIMYWPR